MVDNSNITNLNPSKQNKSEQDYLEKPPEGWEDEVFKIDDTPENVATALFEVNPKEEGFEWQNLKSDEHKVKRDTRTGRES